MASYRISNIFWHYIHISDWLSAYKSIIYEVVQSFSETEDRESREWTIESEVDGLMLLQKVTF